MSDEKREIGFDPEVWVMDPDRVIVDYYDLVGVPVFCDDLDAIARAIRIANRRIHSYQIHQDKTVSDRAAEILFQLGMANATFADASRLKKHQMQILCRLLSQWEQEDLPAARVNEWLLEQNVAEPNLQSVADALISRDLSRCHATLDSRPQSGSADWLLGVEAGFFDELAKMEKEETKSARKQNEAVKTSSRKAPINGQKFYLATASGVIGPFSGIEVREAALAGIMDPGLGVSHSAIGPWTPAANAGLFDSERRPVEHPPGVQPPSYRCRPEGCEPLGPYRLYELLRFAVQGRLASNVELQNDWSPEWFGIERISILAFCIESDPVHRSNLFGNAPQSVETAANSRADFTADAPLIDVCKDLRHRTQKRSLSVRAIVLVLFVMMVAAAILYLIYSSSAFESGVGNIPHGAFVKPILSSCRRDMPLSSMALIVGISNVRLDARIDDDDLSELPLLHDVPTNAQEKAV